MSFIILVKKNCQDVCAMRAISIKVSCPVLIDGVWIPPNDKNGLFFLKTNFFQKTAEMQSEKRIVRDSGIRGLLFRFVNDGMQTASFCQA